MKLKLTAEDAFQQLSAQTELPFTVLMKHGTMSIEYFAPRDKDTQTPHLQDEIYVIISGHGTFNRNEERITFKEHDILFVPAGKKHRFENFSDDFATWVIFYGAEGGE